ncbi:MAG: SIS domain-containing protein [Treponema sp.]|nr:SIS domain-containing protein [Treponema sp.]
MSEFKKFTDDYTAAISRAMEKIDPARFGKIIEILAEAYKNDRQVFIAGNGGSAGTANHFVCDFGKNAVPFKGTGPGKRRFRIISVCDNIEKITALGNDISFEEIFRQQLINLMREGDILIVISASGNSPNIVRACEYAREIKARIIVLAGFNGGKIKEFADEAIVVPLESYEQIEDVHMVLIHMIVYYFKNHPEITG